MRDWIASLTQVQTPMILLVVLRVVVGCELFMQGNEKLRLGYFERVDVKQSEFKHPMEIKLRVWIEEERSVPVRSKGVTIARRSVRMFEWYKFFLEYAVLPNMNVFAILVAAAELLLGAMLALGLLTRIASVMGILLILNYLLATWHYGFPYVTLNVLFLAALLVFLIGGLGRCLGLDALFHERFPEIPLF